MNHIGFYLANDESKIGVTYTPEQWRRAEALEEAMQGIEDPAEFVRRADALANELEDPIHLERIDTGEYEHDECPTCTLTEAYRKARGKASQ